VMRTLHTLVLGNTSHPCPEERARRTMVSVEKKLGQSLGNRTPPFKRQHVERTVRDSMRDFYLSSVAALQVGSYHLAANRESDQLGVEQKPEFDRNMPIASEQLPHYQHAIQGQKRTDR
jgi:hypothetical protein